MNIIDALCLISAGAGFIAGRFTGFRSGKHYGFNEGQTVGFKLGKDTQWVDDQIEAGRKERARRSRNGQFISLRKPIQHHETPPTFNSVGRVQRTLFDNRDR